MPSPLPSTQPPSSSSGAATQAAHSDRYGQALLWAAQLHRGQFRKGKPVPYISHLISVSALVWEDGGNEDQAIAGRFGNGVADIVVACKEKRSATTGASSLEQRLDLPPASEGRTKEAIDADLRNERDW